MPGAALANALLAPDAVRAFYAARQQLPAWKDDVSYDALVQAIAGMAAHGLDPADYHAAALHRLRDNPAAREEIATDAWLSAAAHLAFGKLSPVKFEPDWTAARRQINLAAHLEAVLSIGDIASSLEQLAPREPAYHRLTAELARLRQISDDETALISPGPALKPGMASPRIVLVRKRLMRLGYTVSDPANETYNSQLTTAVQAFQFDNGLEPDGVIGSSTITAMNFGTAAKTEKVRINLERWRWLPNDLGARHVRVNIAAFEVTAFADDSPVHTYRAVVGRPYRKTPVFSDNIRYIVFNPWWETPAKLARQDKLPAFQKDPTLIDRLGFQVLDKNGQLVDHRTIDWGTVSADTFPYRLRQAPGDDNALGQVKIMFPNPHSVYLHDTPSRELFERRERAFSSGCVRVQNVLDLAAWLLAETSGWDRSRIDRTVASGLETRVNLAAPVPVHLLYMTATVGGNREVRYLNDIYARDDRVLEGLNKHPVLRN
jgi:murein L,D-transpeptidase YcbB/YkuD